MLEDNTWLSLLWMLVVIVLIIGAAYWATRHIAGRGVFGSAGSGALEVLAQLTVGKDQRLIVVRAGGRYFLLGVASGSISTLAEFTAEEAAEWKQEHAEVQTPPSFREALQITLKSKGRR